MKTHEAHLHRDGAHKRTLNEYFAALGAVAAMLFLRALLDPVFGSGRPYITLFAAVAFAVWFSRWKPAALAAVVAFVAANYFFVRPRYGLAFTKLALADFAMYLISCSVIIILGEAMHRVTERAEKARLERLHAEASEREQKELLRVTLSSIGDGVIVCDPSGRVRSLNDEAERLTGWRDEEATGKPLDEIFVIVNEASGVATESPVAKVIREGGVVGLANHTVLVSKSGARTPIDDSAAPIREDGGPLLGIVLVFRDVTEQRASQRESAELAAIVEYSGEAIITKDVAGIVQTWNAAAEQLYGYHENEIVGQPISLLLPADRKGEEEQILRKLREGVAVQRYEGVRLTRDGRRIHVAVSVSPIRDQDGRVIGASNASHDISETIKARAAAAQEHEWLSTTLASIGDAVITTDGEGHITYLNPIAEEVTGWNGNDASGHPLERVFRIVNEDSHETAENPVARALREGTIVGLANHTVLIRKDGTERAIDDSAAPIRNTDGRVIGCVLVFRDISERRQEAKRAENEIQRLLSNERKARAEVERTNRMKDEFLATLSHELRTPLNAILGFGQIIEKNPGDVKIVKEGVQIITRNAKIQVDLISDLLDMSRIVSGKLRLDVRDVNLVDVVNAGVDAIRHSAQAKGIRVEMNLPRIAPVSRGDEGRLQQVVWNLLSNAVKFTPRHGRIDVTLHSEGTNATITVHDTGVGIQRDMLPYLFERFRQADSSAAREHAGLGIGLAIVKHLVELHGGSVYAESEGEGNGATFTVELPLAGAPSVSQPVEPKAGPEPVATEVEDDDVDLEGLEVLAIDDQPDSRMFLTRILEEHHARVLNASSAKEGLFVLKKHKPNIVLCDIGMPGVDGYQFIRTMRESGDHTPALAVTAFARPEDRLRALRAGYQGHITKPINPAELLATIAVFTGTDNA
jgi:PAS domain S-box-containing protein